MSGVSCKTQENLRWKTDYIYWFESLFEFLFRALKVSDNNLKVMDEH